MDPLQSLIVPVPNQLLRQKLLTCLVSADSAHGQSPQATCTQ